MSVPKIVGVETEYGIAWRGGGAAFQAARDLFDAIVERPLAWDYAAESASRDARGILRIAQSPVEDEPGNRSAEPPSPVSVVLSRDDSAVLANGARFYIDHTHPEYCTPECATARELVAWDRAGEQWLTQKVQRFNEDRDPSRQVLLFKNNSDHQGHSYGCHENYLMAADIYEDLFNNSAHWLYAYWLPFLVTRQVFCGAGKVDVEQDTDHVDYQISQRADFFERVIGLQTTHHRPIINTRDEPHADPHCFRRLHVICGDANMAEWSTYLKIAVTQLILLMLEAHALDLRDEVMLADPVAAFKIISRDPTLKATVPMEYARRAYSALDIQRVFLDAAQRYVESDTGIHARWHPVWQDWANVIEQLASEPERLDDMLDWRIKWKFLRTQIERKGIHWQHAMAHEMDIKYHQLDPQAGFFYLLRQAGQVKPWLTEQEVLHALHAPPDSTRAFLRGYCVQAFAEQLTSANWDALTFRWGEGQNRRMVHLRLSDPAAGTRDQIESLLGSETESAKVLDTLRDRFAS